MAVLTVEGVIENGQIRIQENIKLPENAKVFVIIPNAQTVSQAYIYSPRLVHPEQSVDFIKQIMEVSTDAEL